MDHLAKQATVATPLTTDCMLLRPYREADFSCFAALNANKLARRHVGTGEVLSESAARVLFDAFVKDKDATGRDQAWAAILHTASKYIGHVFLTARSGETHRELGFLFDPTVWGQGFATEAACRVIHYALDGRGEQEVLATVDCDHAAAIRVLEKAGMTLRKHRTDELGAYLVYSIGRPARA